MTMFVKELKLVLKAGCGGFELYVLQLELRNVLTLGGKQTVRFFELTMMLVNAGEEGSKELLIAKCASTPWK